MSLPAGDYSPATLTYLDRSAEKSTMQVYGTLLTALNFAAQATLWEAFYDAVDALTLGTSVRRHYEIEQTFAEAIPVSNLAQRENKLLVMYRDATNGQKFTVTVPTIDLSKLTFLTGAGDNVSLTTGAEVIAFVTAFEDFVINPVTTNATVIASLKFVGRNS